MITARESTHTHAVESTSPPDPVTAHPKFRSARERELLEAAYAYVLANGMAEFSLRPLASAIGTSPRVLLFLFGSKDGLVRALLARAREDELSLLGESGDGREGGEHRPNLAAAIERTWAWLAAAEHRPLLRLWAEAYARSLVEPDGPWGGFAEATVADWLTVLGASQPEAMRSTEQAETERVLALAVLRGALLHLLATEDAASTTAAITTYVSGLRRTGTRGR